MEHEETVSIRWLNRLSRSSKTSEELYKTLCYEGILKSYNGTRGTERVCVLSALVEAVKRGDEILYVSSDRNVYKKYVIINCSKVPARCNFAATMEVLTCLSDCGYILWEKGYKINKTKRSFGKIEFTSAFVNIVNSYCEHSIYTEDKNVMIITDEQEILGREFKRGENMKGKSIIEKMQKYNSFIEQHDITFNGVEINTWLCRIFKENLDTHGRIYNLYQKVNYQTLSQLDRKNIRIDNEDVVELDYKHLHPSILYEMEGVKYDGDMYHVDIDFDEVFDTECGLVGVNYPLVLRDLCKQVLLRMINNSSKQKCVVSVVKFLSEDNNLDTPFRKYPNLYPDLHNVAKCLMKSLEAKHKIISHHFYTEKSLLLMNKDSEILMEVLGGCMDINIVALPLHDSVTIKAVDKDKVLTIMKNSYNSIMGTCLNCQIDEK